MLKLRACIFVGILWAPPDHWAVLVPLLNFNSSILTFIMWLYRCADSTNVEWVALQAQCGRCLPNCEKICEWMCAMRLPCCRRGGAVRAALQAMCMRECLRQEHEHLVGTECGLGCVCCVFVYALHIADLLCFRLG